MGSTRAHRARCTWRVDSSRIQRVIVSLRPRTLAAKIMGARWRALPKLLPQALRDCLARGSAGRAGIHVPARGDSHAERDGLARVRWCDPS